MYAWLFKSIKLKDLLHEGKFYPMAVDTAIMSCCCEMAGRHFYCVPDVLYIYNNTNEFSHYRLNRPLQRSLHDFIMTLTPYQVLKAPCHVESLDEFDTIGLVVVCDQEATTAITDHNMCKDNKFQAMCVMVPSDSKCSSEHVE